MGIYSANNLTASLEGMYQDNLLPVKWLNAARGQSRAVEAMTLELFITQDQNRQQEILQDVQERAAEVDTLLSDYGKTTMDTYEQERLPKLMDELQIYRTERSKAVDLALAGKQDEAYTYFAANAQTTLML